MTLHNASEFEVGYNLGLEKSGHHCLVLVAKATFEMPQNINEEAKLKAPDEQMKVYNADVYMNESDESATLYENDFAPFKPKCDVILNGTAYAYPLNETANRVVRLKVSSLDKSFRVIGKRVWEDIGFTLRASTPKPFTKQGIAYDVAYGGFDFDPNKVSENDENYVSFIANPSGQGYTPYHESRSRIGKPLAQTEEIYTPAIDPTNTKYRPQSFGVLARHCYPRSTLGGTYDDYWLNELRPELPQDFDEHYYQSTPKEQQISYLVGGEVVSMIGLRAKGELTFILPKLEVVMEVIRNNGDREQLNPVVDTLILEPDENRFIMVSRAKIKLKRSLHEIDTVVVGKPDEFWEKQRLYGECYTREIHEKMKREEGDG